MGVLPAVFAGQVGKTGEGCLSVLPFTGGPSWDS